MPSHQQPYIAELTLRPLNLDRRYEITLSDRERAGVAGYGTVDLQLSDIEDSETGFAVDRFLDQFLNEYGPPASDGITFGRIVAGRLFPNGRPIGELWREIADKRGNRPLVLVLTLPPEHVDPLSEMPFELLPDPANPGEFLFFSFGNVLIRCVQGLPHDVHVLRTRASALLVSANPVVSGPAGDATRLPATLFEEHASALQSKRLLDVRDPLHNATIDSFRDGMQSARPELLSIVVHGSATGGSLMFHAESEDYPEDRGVSMDATSFASALRQAGTKIAVLWSCHGARRHPDVGSVAEKLLDPQHGNLAAVVASHAALRGEVTPRLAKHIVEALAGSAAGDLALAVAEARRRMPREDLQWAAPVYYGRPRDGATVHMTVKESAVQVLEEVGAPDAIHTTTLRDAPTRVPFFQGRTNEIEEGLAILRVHRLLSITGFPGIGKTEVAIAIAERACDDPTIPINRAWWCSLEGVSETPLLRTRIALLLDLTECDDDEVLARALATSPTLLVLDNAEDLIRAEQGPFQQLCATVLRIAPGTRIVLSTRELLGDPAGAVEQQIKIDGLEPAEARAAFLGACGARLPATQAASPEVVDLIDALDGHPRALVLVASQVGRGVSIARILERLRTSDVDAVVASDMLGKDPSDQHEADRAKRLVASLELSFQPMAERDPIAADLFCWLSFMPNGLPTVLVRPIFGDSGEDAVAVLHHHSLVEERGRDRRLTLPAPLRWFAARKLPAMEPERREELIGLHVEAYAHWMRSVADAIGSRRSGLASRQALAEAEHLRTWGEFDPHPPALPWMQTLASFVAVATYVGQAKLAIDILEATNPSQLDGQPLALRVETLGDLYVRTARLADAETHYLDALPIYREFEDRLGEANTVRALGDLYVRTARLADAETHYLDALPIYREIEVRLGEANTIKALGDLYVRTDRLADAETHYLDALPIYREIEARLGEANTIKALGDLYVRTDRLADAETHYLDALPIYREIEDRLGEANTIQALGDLYVRTARLADAETHYLDALPIYREIEARLGEANTIKALGDLYVRTARLADAETHYLGALPIYREIEARLGEANTIKALGDLYVRTARLADAETHYLGALPIYREIEDRLGEANAIQALGDLCVRTDRLADAETHYLDALPIYREIEVRLGEANTIKALGDLYVRTARLADAETHYLDALPIYREIEARLGEANTIQALGDLYVRTARLADAETHYLGALPIYREIEARLGEANTIKALGDLYVRTARLADAETHYLGALPIYREIEDRLGEANAIQALGDLCVRTDRLADAETHYLDALPIYREIEARLGEANTIKALGDLYVRTDRLADAETHYLGALPIYRETEDRLGEANSIQALGNLASHRRDFALAFKQLSKALAIQREIGDALGAAGTLGYLARATLRADRDAQAAVLAGHAWRALRQIDDRFGQSLVLSDLGRALQSTSPQGSASAMVLSWQLKLAIGDPGARELGQVLARIMPDLDPGQRLSESDLAGFHEAVERAITELEEGFAREERDPFEFMPDEPS